MKKKDLKLVIAILTVLVVGLSGYIVHDKLLDKNEISKESISDSYYSNLSKNREVTQFYISGSPLNFLLDKNGDVYYNESYGYSFNTNETEKDYVIEDATLSNDNSNVFHGYKLDISNVLMIYYGNTGQGGYGTYVFVKENGNVAVLTVNPDLMPNASGEKEVSIIELKEIDSLKNIVAVIEDDTFDGENLKVIDINGNHYNLGGMKLN